VVRLVRRDLLFDYFAEGPTNKEGKREEKGGKKKGEKRGTEPGERRGTAAPKRLPPLYSSIYIAISTAGRIVGISKKGRERKEEGKEEKRKEKGPNRRR